MLISRKDAKLLGLKIYVSDNPCKNGHTGERYVSDSSCTICAKARAKARQTNRKEEVQLQAKKYYERNKEEILARTRDYAAKNAEKISKSRKEYRDRNLEEVKKKKREYHNRLKNDSEYRERRKKYREQYEKKNKETLKEKRRLQNKRDRAKRREDNKRHRKENPELHRTYRQNRRARIEKADGHHTSADIKNILQSQNFKCEGCEVDLDKNYHVDHVMPVYLGGSNWPGNLQILCPSCNTSKGRKHPCDWLPPKYRKKDDL